MVNLVLGVALRYDFEKIRVFVESFRFFNSKDDLVLLVDNISDEFVNSLKKFNVKLVQFPEWKNYYTSICNSRHFKYLDFVKNNVYDYILLSDTFDVVFQDDPFKNLSGDFIYFFEEDDNFLIKDNEFNSNWIKFCYGDEVYEKLKHYNISCAGTVLGSYSNILIYLNLMLKKVKEILDINKDNFTRVFDQGIHNYIVRCDFDKFSNSFIFKNNGYVLTLALTLRKNPEFILTDRLYYEDNMPVIIHQYNRSEKLTVYFNNFLKS